MFKWAKKYIKNKNKKLDYIKLNSKKYQLLTKKDIKNMLLK